MAAAVERPPSLTEGGDLLASRRRRGLRHALPAAPEPASVPCAATAARSGGERIRGMDSYKKLELIGAGAFGAVHKARDLRTGAVVAIKSARGGGGGGQAALMREAALLAACAGIPEVVALREVARGPGPGGGLHLVMEYVGPSLHDVIGARRRAGLPFVESETCRAMAQLLAGAGSMHARGVVHRDLKPGNVLVGEHDRRLRICDLGLATSAAALPPPDAQLEGTPGYMAPEVLLCEEGCGAPVDVWALGCIMAELVAGRQLFPEDDLCRQLINIVKLLGIPDEVSLMPLGVSAPSKLREKVPEERLSQAGFDVLRGLLEYDPKNRLTAAAALQMPWFAANDD